jgi:FkbM family methyltransferase
MKQSKFFQLLFEAAIGTRKIAIPASGKIAFRLYNKLALNKKYANKYLIAEKIGNYNLLLPVNHRLPWTLKKTPTYSRNLGRINQYISAFSKEYAIIDIGANIGDSAILLRETDNPHRIICVEGNPEYLPLLEENVKQLKNVTVIKSFVGQDSENKHGELISDGRGTTHVKESSEGEILNYISLGDIIEKSKIKNEIRLLKIDTDGYDCQIIKGNINVIKKYKPVLFFEYAPSWFPDGKDSQSDIFSFLAANDYHHFIFYDGYGNYMISCDTMELGKISKEMHFYLSCGSRFGDIAVFHKEDSGLFKYTVEQEKFFFQKYYNQ